MRKINRILAAFALAAMILPLAAGCRSNGAKNAPAKAVAKTKAGNPADNRYEMPEVPAMVGDNQEALDYITTHYWDKFFSEDRPGVQDTSLVRGFSHQAYEEIFYQFALFLRGASVAKGLDACRTMLDKAEKAQLAAPDGTLWGNVTDMYYHILQDPNSPWRNEEFCIPLLEKRISSSLSTDSERQRAERDLPRFCLNRLGEKANDFSFTLRNGRTKSVYGIDAEYTILFFSNPGCPNCREVMESLQQFPGIDGLIETKRLAVANIYPDEDLGEWIKYSEIYPKNWLNGYDHLLAVNNTPLYNLRAIPSVYLLDKDKRVLLKDVPTDFLMQYLGNLFQIQ